MNLRDKPLAALAAFFITFFWFLFLAWLGGVDERNVYLWISAAIGTIAGIVAAGMVYDGMFDNKR